MKNATTGDIIGGEPLPSGQGLPPARQFVMESQTNSPDGPYKLSNYLDIRNGTHGTVFNWCVVKGGAESRCRGIALTLLTSQRVLPTQCAFSITHWS